MMLSCIVVLPEEEVHDGGGVDMPEQELNEARLGLDEGDHLEGDQLVGEPILYHHTEENKNKTHTQQIKTQQQQARLATAGIQILKRRKSFLKGTVSRDAG
jgi:hypothetical protein